MKKSKFFIAISALTLAACATPPPQATAAPTLTLPPTETPTVTFTATPSQTPTPEPTPTPDPAQIAAEEMGKLNLTLGVDYTLAPDADGNLAAFDKNGNKIYEPSTNLWNSNLIAGIVENMLKKTGDCEKTPFPPGTNIMDRRFENWRASVYYSERAENAGLSIRAGQHFILYPFRSVPGYCWGFGVSKRSQAPDMEHAYVFFYPDSEGVIQVFELFNPKK